MGKGHLASGKTSGGEISENPKRALIRHPKLLRKVSCILKQRSFQNSSHLKTETLLRMWSFILPGFVSEVERMLQEFSIGFYLFFSCFSNSPYSRFSYGHWPMARNAGVHPETNCTRDCWCQHVLDTIKIGFGAGYPHVLRCTRRKQQQQWNCSRSYIFQTWD